MTAAALVGRVAELRTLRRLLDGLGDGDQDGVRSVAVVLGDAGFGKTRLVAEAVAGHRGGLLQGGCLPLATSVPFLPVAEAFAGLSTGQRRRRLDEALDRSAPFVRQELARLVPTLPEATSAASEDTEGAARGRLFMAVRETLEALSEVGQAPHVFVIEDLHWADPDTLDLLSYLVSGPSRGWSLVVTSRYDELPEGHPLRDWVATTQRLPHVRTIALRPLDDAAVATLVEDLLAHQADTLPVSRPPRLHLRWSLPRSPPRQVAARSSSNNSPPRSPGPGGSAGSRRCAVGGGAPAAREGPRPRSGRPRRRLHAGRRGTTAL